MMGEKRKKYNVVTTPPHPGAGPIAIPHRLVDDSPIADLTAPHSPRPSGQLAVVDLSFKVASEQQAPET